MPMPEQFKYDVRVRERLQRRGLLTESEVEQHLTTLADVSANATDIELKQPALQTEAERAENSIIVRPAPPRPISVPSPISLDDEDEEEELEKPAVVAARPAAPRTEEAVKIEEPAAGDEDEEDDEDEDDEDDEDEEEEDEVAERVEEPKAKVDDEAPEPPPPVEEEDPEA